MKFLISVLMVIFTLVGCERIEGLVTVSKDIKLKNSKGDMHLVQIGTYNADIKAKTSKKITLRLNNDSDEKFIFEHDGNIPEEGTFSIPSVRSGQPVDLFGSIKTVITKSNVNEAIVSCTYQVPYTICNPGYGCVVQYRIYNGTQWMRYYDVTSTKNINLTIKAANSSQESGDFHGDIVNNDRIILNQSDCH